LIALDISVDFSTRVLELVKQIPSGRVSTYGAIALALSKPKAARAVGNVLHNNPTPVIVPCHRIVCTSGRLGGFSLGVSEKISLLKLEGVKVCGGFVVDFNSIYFDEFKIV